MDREVTKGTQEVVGTANREPEQGAERKVYIERRGDVMEPWIIGEKSGPASDVGIKKSYTGEESVG